jgi:hypothetical protein
LRLIIDRFNGIYAVCETEERKMINVEKSKLPAHAKEGDVLIVENGIYNIDLDSTKRRKKDIEKLMDDVWEG